MTAPHRHPLANVDCAQEPTSDLFCLIACGSAEQPGNRVMALEALRH